ITVELFLLRLPASRRTFDYRSFPILLPIPLSFLQIENTFKSLLTTMVKNANIKMTALVIISLKGDHGH
ncbi:hypothetical protein, partial [Ornithinibacillus halophilus]|uniref:hypothetical protein n=1 Tax=Ornithinibacillus halophilus TaxID=930117 RepID=UPI001F2F99B4